MFLLLSDTYLVGWDWLVLEQSMMFLLAITLKRVPACEAGRGCAQVPRHLVLLSVLPLLMPIDVLQSKLL